MKEKLAKLLSKIPFKPSQKLGKVFAILKWSVLLLVGSVFSTMAAVAIWFYLQPLHKLVPRIENFLSSELKAESVKIDQLKWKFALGHLGVGLDFKNLKIKGTSEFESLEVSNVQLVTQPLKVFLGKFPFSLSLNDAELVIGESKGQSVDPEKSDDFVAIFSDETKQKIKNLQNSTIAKVIRLQVELNSFAVFESQTRNNRLLVNNGQILFSGFPGTFKFELKLSSDWAASRWSFVGESELLFTGFFQTWEGSIVGIKLEDLRAYLDSLVVKHKWGLHKPSNMPSKVSAEAQIVFDKDLNLTAMDLSQGIFTIDEIATDFSLRFKNTNDYTMLWSAGAREMEQLKLPIVGLEGIPFKGIFEVNARFQKTEKAGMDASWKMNFNNFRVDTAKLSKFFDEGSYGEIRFSFVNEIEIKGNTIRLPRSEFQMTGTHSQIEVGERRFIKPKGDALEILVKAGTKDDVLFIDHINLKANNLEFEAKAEVGGFSDFVMKAIPGKLKADVLTNNVDLTPWSPYFPVFRKVPLEGTVQFSGSADGPVYSDSNPFREISWRIDRFSASKIRGSVDRDAFIHLGLPKPKTHLNGPFTVDFLLQGRGYGDNIHRGTFLTHVDLTKMGMVYKEKLRKSAGIPLMLDFSVEKSQNKLIVRRGQLRAHEADLVLSGQLAQGSNRSELEFRLQKPIKLENWRDFFSNLPKDMPLKGLFNWRGRITFDGQEAMEGNVDLTQLNLEGMGEAKELNFWLPELTKPIENGSATLLVQKDGMYLSQGTFKSGPTTVQFSGSALFRNKNKKSGTFARFVGNDPIEVDGQITLDDWDEFFFSKNIVGGTSSQAKPGEDLASQSEVAKNEPVIDLKNYLDSPRVRDSKFKLAVRSTLKTKTSFGVKAANSLVNWSDGIFRADPLQVLLWGGAVKGSVTIDARPFFDRKEKPIWSITAETERLDVEPFLRLINSQHSGKIGGNLNSQLQWAGEGLDNEELSPTLRGRIFGKLEDGFFNYFDPLRTNYRDIVFNSAASDYFVNELDFDKCFQLKTSIEFDAQLRDGVIVVQKSTHKYGDNALVNGTGSLDANNLAFAGVLELGSQCHLQPMKSCFEKHLKKMDFQISNSSEGIVTNIDPILKGKLFADCLDSEIGRRTVTQKRNMESGAAPNESLADKWRNLLRNSE